MSQALATSVSTGTSLALLWKVLDGASHSPMLFCPPRPWFELHWPNIAPGIFIGLLLGPILEALVSLRSYLTQAVLCIALCSGGITAEVAALAFVWNVECWTQLRNSRRRCDS